MPDPSVDGRQVVLGLGLGVAAGAGVAGAFLGLVTAFWLGSEWALLLPFAGGGAAALAVLVPCAAVHQRERPFELRPEIHAALLVASAVGWVAFVVAGFLAAIVLAGGVAEMILCEGS